MSQLGAQAQEAGTVIVRVQVVDVESAALDLMVPTYLPTKDVTQRIARDANLGAYWPDGTRRRFWIRARGRLLGEDEKLSDVGVVDGELIHILPQPPEGSGVIERPPEYPKTTGYRGGNIVVMIGSALTVLAFAALWAVSLTVDLGIGPALVLGAIPALAIALLSVSTARHLFGPPGSSIRIPLVGLVLFVPVFALAFIPGFVVGADVTGLGIAAGVGFVIGIAGIIMGWLAWFGAVEPLPEVNRAEETLEAVQQASVAQCAICGGDVDLNDMEIRQDCGYGCGRVFHQGCYRARAAIAREGQCAVCGYQPGAA
jgi:uncharacterized ubiquitin-like protein YukD